ncbi:DNA polymerase [Flavobacterium sp. Fl-318]|uniref:DNA polymerase n=1 Tax=Flavobacterium cupriresistens TaxID=2893885 RepID=A0ABU4R5N0_9FLAO|nr:MULTISPECIES: DNA polymerase [unclassified Flavobacterium]MDX6187894.1 DNA polymerase [Flavobacterium sp. Fl-318]UFH42186.1 DNA polymerase [Flavobacterium sp. F-323]
MEIIILKHISYLKGKKKIIYYSKIVGGEVKTHKNLDFFKEEEIYNIISFDFLNIIDAIEINERSLFTDIEQLKKQIIGHSKNEFSKNDQPWDFWYLLKQLHKNADNEEMIKKLEKAKKIYFGFNDGSSDSEIKDIFGFLLSSIEDILKLIYEELKERNEIFRHETVEKKISSILLERTKKGIKIDTLLITSLIRKVNIEFYEVKNRLQLEYGIFSRTDFENIKKEVGKILPALVNTIGTNEYIRNLKFYKDDFDLIKLLYEERKLSINKTILTRIGSLDDKKIFPQFQSFGTVTSRILVEYPSLQQLKRDYRNIILPEDGMELLYIDYCQFEAGILASEANDLKLIEMYNMEDIYSQMNEVLKNVPNISRDKCKKLFFSYCYGMSKENIKKVTNIDLDIFFNKFPELEKFNIKLKKKFRIDGFVETTQGNKRYKSFDNKNNEEESWLISQRIQGNASLILKKAIIEVYNLDKEIEFLIPMHDAVLYQIPIGKRIEKSKFLETHFKKAFKEICPKIEPAVEFKPFYDPK